MAPYVALSWLAGGLGDRLPRIRLLRGSTWVRAGLLTAAGTLLECLLLCGLPLAGLAATPTAHWALVSLAVLGASGTGFECQMTSVIQHNVPDRARAFALGLADTVMMSAAVVGTSLAPLLASQLGPRSLCVLCALSVTSVIGLRVGASSG
jgi:MFS family permease